jgi:hypothetical protein
LVTASRRPDSRHCWRQRGSASGDRIFWAQFMEQIVIGAPFGGNEVPLPVSKLHPVSARGGTHPVKTAIWTMSKKQLIGDFFCPLDEGMHERRDWHSRC